ncbi:MAG: DNA polymerase I [Lachnospiraceae bacterium]|nr:DNA polymerase I [Lachnospiraceae bacterium]
MKQEQSKKILLIDGHSILNRAFFGLPDLTNTAGLHTNAVYGFLNIMFKFIETEKPDYLTVAFDEHAPTFRHKMFEAYKGTRKPMAEELRQQVPMMKQMLLAMGVTVISKPGLEADDLLGTVARIGEEQGMEVTIVSGDRDLLQLATTHTKISIPKTKKTGTEIENYYEADVKERYLVTPKEFIDVKALMGDTADNIPGVPGIGEKTATAIIEKFHSIEEAHAHAEELKPPRASKNIVEFYDQAVLSKTLATIEVHADIDFDINHAILGDLYTPEAYELCREWEFKNLLGRFSVEKPTSDVEETFVTADAEKDVASFVDETIKNKSQNVGVYFTYECVDGTQESNEESDGQLSLFDTPKEQKKEKYSILCVALSYGEKTIYFSKKNGLTYDFLREQLERLAKVGVVLCSDHLKELIKVFTPQQRGRFLNYENSFDVDVADYLLHPLKNQYFLEDMAGENLQMSVVSYQELFGKKTISQAMEEQDSEFETYACYQAYLCCALWEKLTGQLKEDNMYSLYENIELPLVFTLADMELDGIAIDGEALSAYGEKLSARISELEETIYEQAGEKFNINSPKQLGVILFEKMELPGAKKTKTGYSTAADVLENLAADVPFVADILEYRQLAKLKSTYADGLAHCIEADGRIRSSFQQTVTATGRISSTEPNLQNIPIRMELGKLIRKVFHPKEGYVFVDADYSQIELRVLSHMSGDENLIQAFLQGQDIHRSTASLVFHTPFDEVTELQRRNAKAVNFGIVYGISAFGLSRDLGIGKKEAQKYIDDYFLAYPKMKTFLDGLVEEGKEQGKVTTMYGRIRPIPELSSSNFMQRQFGERIAMNSPIQGTAADIIKIAMVRVHDRLQKEGLESRLLLQVHDELLIETKTEELEQVKALLAEEMQKAADLSVPLEVDMHTGNTWYDAK